MVSLPLPGLIKGGRRGSCPGCELGGLKGEGLLLPLSAPLKLLL